MDSLITAAGRALAAGDPLAALKRIALRDDAPALALRGIAMAQLGEFANAKDLVRRAARAFGAGEPVARARCVVAEAEIALVSRDLRWPTKTLEAARATLAAYGDQINAAYGGYLDVRRLLLIGRLEEADKKLDELNPTPLPPALRAAHALVVAGIAMRRLQASKARTALEDAQRAARLAGIPALIAEVETASHLLKEPAARLIAKGVPQLLLLDDVETLSQADTIIIDACRHMIRHRGTELPLATRPVLFALARTLGEAWPADVSRETLVARAFCAKNADESHRARLRVEIGRLRSLLAPLAGVRATKSGFAMMPLHGRSLVVLAPPVDEQHADMLAFLADGEAWSSSALALALGVSQRNVQRMLEQLAGADRVQPVGRGRARRWTAPLMSGLATMLLLPPPLPDH